MTAIDDKIFSQNMRQVKVSKNVHDPFLNVRRIFPGHMRIFKDLRKENTRAETEVKKPVLSEAWELALFGEARTVREEAD